MTIIGYVWASSVGEDVEHQKKALDEANVDRFIIEVQSGSKRKLLKLKSILSELQRGDTFMVYSIELLGLSVYRLIEIVDYLCQRGVGFRSLEENIDTTTTMDKLMFQKLGVPLANVDRNHIQRRTAAGLAATKSRCRSGGRRLKVDEKQRAVVVALHKDPSNAVPDICRKLKISQATYYRLLGNEARRKAGRKPKTKNGEGLPVDGGRTVNQKTHQRVGNG